MRDALGVDGLVGLEVIERAARAPRPGAQRAPVVRLARLALVRQADDALRQPAAVVGLDAGRDERWRSPSRARAPAAATSGPRRPGGSPARRRRRRASRRRAPRAARRRSRTPSPPAPARSRRAGVVSVSWISTLICGYARVVDAADELLRDDRHAADCSSFVVDVTSHFTAGTSFGHAAVHLAVEQLDDLRPALLPPLLAASSRAVPSFEPQRVGQVRVRRRLALVGVGGERRVGLGVGAAAQLVDLQQVQHPAVVLSAARGCDVARAAGCVAAGGPATPPESASSRRPTPDSRGWTGAGRLPSRLRTVFRRRRQLVVDVQVADRLRRRRASRCDR